MKSLTAYRPKIRPWQLLSSEKTVSEGTLKLGLDGTSAIKYRPKTWYPDKMTKLGNGIQHAKHTHQRCLKL